MHNFRSAPLLVFLMLTLALVGCGGQNSGSNLNIYEGSYSGTWTLLDGSSSGTIAIVVSSNGAVTGTAIETDSAEAATVSGTLSSTGSYSMDLAFGTTTTIHGNGVASLNGITLTGDATDGFSFSVDSQ